MNTKLLSRRIGTITFDAVTEENHTSTLAVSENPIESGAMIADHAVVKPKEISIQGVMVSHNHSSSLLENLNVPYIRGISDFLDKVPLPVSISVFTSQTIARANRVLSQVDYVREQVSNTLEQTRELAPWLPDFGLGGLVDSSNSDNRVQKCYADLVALQKSGETVEIRTGLHTYSNMQILSIGVKQTMDGSAFFSIDAKEIFIVDTVTTKTSGNNKGTSPKKSGTGKSKKDKSKSKKSGRAKKQSAGKSQKGKVQLSRRTPPSLDFGNRSSSSGAGNVQLESALSKVF